MTPSETWTSAKADFTALLASPDHAAIFLGTILAYPLHDRLRHEFAMVPAAWLAGPGSSSRKHLADSVHHLYHAHPVESYHFAMAATTTGAIIARHAAFPYTPYHLEGEPESPGLTNLMAHACDMGHIPRGVFGTTAHRVTSIHPPLITHSHPSSDEDMTTRFLTFHVSGSAHQPSAPGSQLHTILATLIPDRRWPSNVVRRALEIEAYLGSQNRKLPLRRRIQLAIAAATYTAADQILCSDTGSSLITDHSALGSWISIHPEAFEPTAPSFA